MTKRCSCGRVHERFPGTFKIMLEGTAFDGVYWNCDCGSTLFAQFGQLRPLLLVTERDRWCTEPREDTGGI